jgi:extracellular elastinolytic metalloproteinase
LPASEYTWQSNDGTNYYTTTQGDNAIAEQDWSGNTTNMYQPNSPNLKFEYEYDPGAKDPNMYRDASITQLFYTANFCRDVLYELGFNEAAGNF